MNKPENQILVIFGASGDLTKRKLIPAIFDLKEQGYLPEKFAVVGVGRTQMSDQSFRTKMETAVDKFVAKNEMEAVEIDNFLKCLHYVSLNTKEASEYEKLKDVLGALDERLETGGNYIFYLATPPSLYTTIAHSLGQWGLSEQGNGKGWKRIIVEKPFGYDLASSLELNRNLLEVFEEDQVYRIDHYLGKETVQNILVTRFANGIFEPLWNRNYVHHVEITSSETIGVEGRGGYYDNSGALRDMLQNHLLQLVGLVAMEPPAESESNAIRNETVKVFKSLRPLTEEDIDENVIRGQYTESVVKGERIKGYRDEDGVPVDSKTETFVAIKFFIDNFRWAGVPFYIRTGKRLPTRVAEIVIHFKTTPHHLFGSDTKLDSSSNQLIIRIQPDEGLLLKFGMKVPGAGFNVQKVNMDFHYSDLSDAYLPTAYERLLLDCMLGDSTLYSRGDAVEATWKFVAPIQEAWKSNPDLKIFGYPAGSWGPEHSDDLVEGEGVTWRYPCKNLSDDGIYCEL